MSDIVYGAYVCNIEQSCRSGCVVKRVTWVKTLEGGGGVPGDSELVGRRGDKHSFGPNTFLNEAALRAY